MRMVFVCVLACGLAFAPAATFSQEIIALSLENDGDTLELPPVEGGNLVPIPEPVDTNFYDPGTSIVEQGAIWYEPGWEFTLVPAAVPMPNAQCPWWRPCGPGNSWGGNRLLYQGAYGADFRPACANHDECLLNPYNSRYGCDRQFLDDMTAACMASDNPAACLHKAHKYYGLVRMFGGFYRW